MSREEQAELAAYRIIDDLQGRSGLGNEWDQIDESIRQEILEEWKAIIVETCHE